MTLMTENSEVQDEEESNGSKLKTHVPLDIKTFNIPHTNEDPQLNDIHTSPSNKRDNSSPLNLQQIVNERDQPSHIIRRPNKISHGFQKMLSRKLDREYLQNMAKEWIKSPINIVLLIWIICVTISGAILFLVMTGMLNHLLPQKHQRETWFEVNNQILNALFTLICLYHHPRRIHHFILLLRWKSHDVSKLRKLYSKNGTYKPHERAHMAIVIFLLNLNCFAQYALCGINVGYTRSERPAIGVAITITVAIAAPAFAGVYTIVSPLGKDYDTCPDEESQSEIRFSFSETNPKWSGGVLDIWNDISVSHLSLFCGFCVFGWNMERLGFGNMYVHTATFLLFCLAPFLIFNMAAINVKSEVVREVLGGTGVFLCVFGLLYGGFWRIQMRKRYNLPATNCKLWCCGKGDDVSDCVSWLFCCWCSLAQEVRTANLYEIVEDNGKSSNRRVAAVEDAILEPPLRCFVNREEGD
ncbi:unnamed protein product [Lactuca saligna]|uniref:PLAC8 motif-containing protein n=1 Tax=Lactuca saligna TaxID=75948 RepID=A0AA35ZNB3_LACSI|nr:unnamed protein product [Lactuca saligna]